MIRFEASEAKGGRPARMIIKVNSLSEPNIIKELYRASQAGVQIELIVRGICCLRPGLKGLSENIRVRSIIGRFLEHSRLFYFHAAGSEKLFCSSADWMSRNLYRRVEIAFPIDDPEQKQRLFRETMQIPLQDNVDAWNLNSDGTYERIQKTTEPSKRSQQELLNQLKSVTTQN